MLPAGFLDRIRGMLRGELGVSLSESDGSNENQDALELLQQIQLEVFAATQVDNLEAFAITVAEHRIADHLRSIRPRHVSIRNRLRYYLRHLPRYAEWPSPHGPMAGLAEWTQGGMPADSIDVAYLVHNPQKIRAGGDPDRMKREDWERLLDEIFRHVGRPLLVRDLAAIVCAVLQVNEVRLEPIGPQIDPPDPHGAPPDLESRELLSVVWAEIGRLLPRQRIALLLNMGSDGDPLLFREAGIASLEEICRSLDLTEAQYQLVLRDLRQGSDGPCATVLRQAPLADLLIARLLGATRDQVIGLRRKARERLARRLRTDRNADGNKRAGSAPSGRAE